jgi:hypothetical protein
MPCNVRWVASALTLVVLLGPAVPRPRPISRRRCEFVDRAATGRCRRLPMCTTPGRLRRHQSLLVALNGFRHARMPTGLGESPRIPGAVLRQSPLIHSGGANGAPISDVSRIRMRLRPRSRRLGCQSSCSPGRPSVPVPDSTGIPPRSLAPCLEQQRATCERS